MLITSSILGRLSSPVESKPRHVGIPRNIFLSFRLAPRHLRPALKLRLQSRGPHHSLFQNPSHLTKPDPRLPRRPRPLPQCTSTSSILPLLIQLLTTPALLLPRLLDLQLHHRHHLQHPLLPSLPPALPFLPLLLPPRYLPLSRTQRRWLLSKILPM